MLTGQDFFQLMGSGGSIDHTGEGTGAGKSDGTCGEKLTGWGAGETETIAEVITTFKGS